ncbi:MAG: hypothetical protein QOI74_458 [Micromonosporaceae bacterium]|nr:hypothetical protein [Micromonosporaceae bacterium]MDT5036954.1 hypothetical protein [Micromonosporaceae bacterium]
MAGTLRRRMAWTALLRVFKPGTPGVGRRLAAIPRMIGATMRGEYDGKSRLAMMTMASLYIVSPIDLVPEAIFLVFGLIDDAAVATFLAGAVLDETERFLEWERQRAMTIPGRAVPGRPAPGSVPGRHPYGGRRG